VRFSYSGTHEQLYPQYRDVATGTTLVAQPGHAYDIEPAEGLTVPGEPDEDGNVPQVPVELPMPPDDRWTAAETRTRRRDTSEES
jgi:hypothetical protein